MAQSWELFCKNLGKTSPVPCKLRLMARQNRTNHKYYNHNAVMAQPGYCVSLES
ncbi:MAG: hypothetical protein V1859_00865 [archaeon]